MTDIQPIVAMLILINKSLEVIVALIVFGFILFITFQVARILNWWFGFKKGG